MEEIFRESNQLDKGSVSDKYFVVPIDTKILTDKDKRKTPEYVNLIKEKMDRIMKVITFTDRIEQRGYLKEA